MRKTVVGCIVFAIIILSAVWILNNNEIDGFDAAAIAEEYFFEEYQWAVQVTEVSYKQVAEKQYIFVADVNKDELQYQCYIYKNGKVAGDDVEEAAILMSFDENGFLSKVSELDCIEAFRIWLNLKDLDSFGIQQEVVVKISLNQLPIKTYDEILWNACVYLETQHVDVFNVTVNTPEFLSPNFELGHGSYGKQFGAISFHVQNPNKDQFIKAYYDFCDQFYLNEDRFSELMHAIEACGGENVYVYMNPNPSNMYELIIYAEVYDYDTKERIEQQLPENPEDFLKIREIPIEFKTNVVLKN